MCVCVCVRLVGSLFMFIAHVLLDCYGFMAFDVMVHSIIWNVDFSFSPLFSLSPFLSFFLFHAFSIWQFYEYLSQPLKFYMCHKISKTTKWREPKKEKQYKNNHSDQTVKIQFMIRSYGTICMWVNLNCFFIA